MNSRAKPLLRVLAGERLDVPPLWMMRQAGRYLPEYRAIRERAGSFLNLCYTPELAAEVTLQPIRRFGFDAAILFSDILIIPHALGLDLDFVEGEGPRLDTVRSLSELSKLRTEPDPQKIGRVHEAVSLIRTTLPDHIALIGFVGGPWTVATYMVGGRGSADHADARLWAARDPDGFSRLIDRIVDASVLHLAGQVEAGAEAVQIFDSWAGELPAWEFERWCVAPIKRIVEALRNLYPDIPIIAFPRAAGTKIGRFAEAVQGVAIGLDTAEDPAVIQGLIPLGRAVQGNLDPLALIAGGSALRRAVSQIREGFAGRPHIFNLGHGIKPETPISHVEQLVTLVREQ